MARGPDVVADTTALVAFATVSDRPMLELSSYLAARYDDLGFRVEVFPDPHQAGKANLVVAIGPESDDPSQGLTLSGHMDVVPVDGQPWSSDPFRVVSRDGRLYGRGTADMKGFLAVALAAAARLPRAALRHRLVGVWTYDEEVGCHGSAALADAWPPRAAFPSACLIGEPTDFRVLRMHPGHVVVEIDVPGAAAHSSRPDLGANAIEAAARVIDRLREARAAWLDPVDPDVPSRGPIPINVARISGGTAVNVVPDACRIEIGYRPAPRTDPHAIAHRIEAVVAEAIDPWLADRGLGPARVEVRRVTPPLYTGPDEPLSALLAAYARRDDDYRGMAPFATDGGNLARLGATPIVYGPGSIEVAHRADEHVAIADLHRATDAIEALIRARCL